MHLAGRKSRAGLRVPVGIRPRIGDDFVHHRVAVSRGRTGSSPCVHPFGKAAAMSIKDKACLFASHPFGWFAIFEDERRSDPGQTRRPAPETTTKTGRSVRLSTLVHGASFGKWGKLFGS